jgi:SAM-dependent methyltransferase
MTAANARLSDTTGAGASTDVSAAWDADNESWWDWYMTLAVNGEVGELVDVPAPDPGPLPDDDAVVAELAEPYAVPDAAVDVVISNCVVNLSGDKPRVLAEMFRVLVPGGRIGISDVVAEDHLTVADRAARGSFSGCIAGALSRQEYLDGLAAAGFVDASVRFTHEAAPQLHAAIVQATKPAAAHE